MVAALSCKYGMRLTELLLEDAETDLSMHAIARDVVDRIVHHFRTADSYRWWGLKFSEIGGTMYAWIEGKQMGLDGELSQAHFLFGTGQIWNPTGAYSRFVSGRPMIRLSFAESIETHDDVASMVNEIITNRKLHLILVHELIHFLDQARNPTMLTPGYTKEGPGYYNSPHEYNAFFHMIADRLISFIQASRKHGASTARAENFGISLDFNETLANILRQYGIHERKFIDSLRVKTRRSLYKRVYKLHQEAVALLNKS